MHGEINLDVLIQNMSPLLRKPDYVFCTVENAGLADFSEAQPLAAFAEDEGLSLVLTKKAAERLGLPFDGVYRCISLGVHSSLEAVGLTAAVSNILARHGIPANVIAAHYHDHIFVPAVNAERAFELLSGYKNRQAE